jgi:hypothetical protein
MWSHVSLWTILRRGHLGRPTIFRKDPGSDLPNTVMQLPSVVGSLYWHPNLGTLSVESRMHFAISWLNCMSLLTYIPFIHLLLDPNILCIPEILCCSLNKLNFGLFWYIAVLIKYSCTQLSKWTLHPPFVFNTQTSSWIDLTQFEVLYQQLDFTPVPGSIYDMHDGLMPGMLLIWSTPWSLINSLLFSQLGIQYEPHMP